MEELQAYLVRQIRLWRPDVIVTHDAPRAGRSSDQCNDDALISLVHQAVLRAVGQAADGNAFAAQIAGAGLEPWAVKKVYGAMASETRGASDLATAQFVPRLGRSLAEMAAEPRGLLHDRFTLSPPTLGFRLLLSTAARGTGPTRSSSAALRLRRADRRGARCRRWPAKGSICGSEWPKNAATCEEILDRAERTVGSVEQLLAQIDDLTRDLDDQSRGQILYQLGDRYYRTGHWPSAAETFQVLSERYPQHALTPQALLWLVQYYASGEAAWRVERGDGQKRFEQAAALGQQIERTRPELFAEPALCFPLAAAYRGLGQARQAERFYQTQSYGGDRDAWSACAQSELHLADPTKGRPAKPMLACVKAQTKPRLDGVLDDPVWQQAKPAALQSAQHDDGDWPAAVMLAYDAEFLYIAAHCRQTPAAGEPAAEIGDGESPRKTSARRRSVGPRSN